jgi:hypothetical protein
MAGFLKEFPMYTEFQYKWNLSIEKRIVMLADSPRVEYDNDSAENKEEIVETGSLKDFLAPIAVKRNK